MPVIERYCPACRADQDVLPRHAGDSRETLRARLAMLGVAGCYLFVSMALMFLLDDPAPPGERTRILVTYGGLAAVHVGLFFWARTAPLAAPVAALLLFIGLQALSAMNDPRSLASFAIPKAALIIILAGAIRVGYVCRRSQRARAAAFPTARVVSGGRGTVPAGPTDRAR